MKKAACITGGASPLGEALTLMLVEEGYEIAIHYHAHQERADKLVDIVRAKGKKAVAIKADLSEGSATCYKLIEQLFEYFPYTSLLFNNAGIYIQSSFADTDEKLFDQHMDLNFKAPFFLTQAFAKHCQEGQVINLIDTYILKHKTIFFPYLLSKKALFHFTKMAAVDLAPHIRVNGISPGIIDIAGKVTEEKRITKPRELPLRILPQVKEVVAAANMILKSPYLVGTVICVDGGQHLML